MASYHHNQHKLDVYYAKYGSIPMTPYESMEPTYLEILENVGVLSAWSNKALYDSLLGQFKESIWVGSTWDQMTWNGKSVLHFRVGSRNHPFHYECTIASFGFGHSFESVFVEGERDDSMDIPNEPTYPANEKIFFHTPEGLLREMHVDIIVDTCHRMLFDMHSWA